MLARFSEETVTDLKITLTALAVLAVARFALYLWDTRNDFDRPKKHGDV